MSPPKFSRLDPAQRHDQILNAAKDLFAERAYDEVSVEDIARAAGVARGLVHHYFGGRKDVYIALLERLGAQREECLRLAVSRSTRAPVADTATRWLDWTEANRTVYLATMGRGEAIADPNVRRNVTELVRRAVALLRDLSRRHRRRLAAASLRAGVLDRAQPRRDAALATRRRHPRSHTRAARLHARTRPAHVRRSPRATPPQTSLLKRGSVELHARSSSAIWMSLTPATE